MLGLQQMSLGKGQNSASILLAASALGFSCDVQKHLPVKVLTSTKASDGNDWVPAIVLPRAPRQWRRVAQKYKETTQRQSTWHETYWNLVIVNKLTGDSDLVIKSDVHQQQGGLGWSGQDGGWTNSPWPLYLVPWQSCFPQGERL